MPTGFCKVNLNQSISDEDIESNFADLHHPFNLMQAKAEAARCLYCYDAPCINACPTSIDVPTFIHQINSENLIGSAKTILSQNIMGGTCARACPTEILCEQACVLNASQQEPVSIGSLQRFAVDHLIENSKTHPFARAALSGKKIAVIGAGPAGLSCAHRAAMLGHDVTVFEAKDKPGGLNEYGLAAYKMVDDFAQKEIDFLLQIGGIKIEYGQVFNQNLFLTDLKEKFDATFIAVGLSKVNQLEVDGKAKIKVIDAIEFIEQIRQSEKKSSVKVGNDVIVIGAGNTAIDAAIQSKRLGARNVTLVYRRGEESMSATEWEVDLARRNEIKLVFWAAPKKLIADSVTTKVEFEKMQRVDNQLKSSGESIFLPADMLLSAIGQKFDLELLQSNNSPRESKSTEVIQSEKGKVKISEKFETSVEGVFAGGDCVTSGEDLTVQAVQDGKLAAHEIDQYLLKTASSLSAQLRTKV